MIWNQHTFMSNPLNTKSLKRHQDIGFRKGRKLFCCCLFRGVNYNLGNIFFDPQFVCNGRGVGLKKEIQVAMFFL